MIEQEKRATALMNLTTLLQLDSESLAKSSYNEQLESLTVFIDNLIKNDFDKLVRLLYRIDVSERKVRSVLAENKGKESSNLIAQLIIEREMEKMETRERFRGK